MGVGFDGVEIGLLVPSYLRRELRMKGGTEVMKDRQSASTSSRSSESSSFLDQLLGWWHSNNADEHYLAAATDLADLERRMRVLDRASDAPIFVTFNH